jgi:integrase
MLQSIVKKQERFLSQSELQRLGQVLNEAEQDGSESPFIIAGLKLLILTGSRLGEIQTLKLDYIMPRQIELPDSKVGARRILLPQAAQDLVNAFPYQPSNPYKIAGKLQGSYATEFQRPWRRIRARAGLPTTRIHNLRHTYPSTAVSGGMPIQMAGRLLGHTQLQTTMRYAHLADQPVLEAAQ